MEAGRLRALTGLLLHFRNPALTGGVCTISRSDPPHAVAIRDGLYGAQFEQGPGG